MQAGPELSIVMINYNAKELTAQAVDSIFAVSPQLSFEIVLVENGDRPEEQFPGRPGVTVLRNVENHGFGHACNTGAAAAKGNCLLFLNNDTIMHPGTLEACTAYLKENPRTGVLGARTLLADGTLDHACKRGFPTPMASLYYFTGMDRRYPKSRRYGAYRQTFLPEDAVAPVDSVAGSFLMMPRRVFEQAGGFDETFFMYGEDIDLCYRVKQAGYEIVYYGAASLTHLKGQSGLHTKSRRVIRQFYDAMALFYNKHYRGLYPRPVSWAVLSAIWAKRTLSLIRARN